MSARAGWTAIVWMGLCLAAGMAGCGMESAAACPSGQTTLCDGVEIVRRLPANLRAAMSERRIKYVIPCSPAMLKFWLGTAWPSEGQLAHPPASCPFTFERHNGAIMRCFTRPLLHRPRFQDELAFGIGQEPQKWLPTIDGFISRWQDGQRAVAIMMPDTYEMLAARGVPMHRIAGDRRRVAVANFALPGEAPQAPSQGQ